MVRWMYCAVALVLLAPTAVLAQNTADWRIAKAYGAHVRACTATAVDATNANLSGPYVSGHSYTLYGYTSATDFTGIGISCLQGTSSVSVTASTGFKVPAGASVTVPIPPGSLYISCKTGSGTGYYDMCPSD